MLLRLQSIAKPIRHEMTEPIDFLNLYREERRKYRQVEKKKIQNNKSRVVASPQQVQAVDSSKNINSAPPTTDFVNLDAIEPIDFAALVEEEKHSRRMPRWTLPSSSIVHKNGLSSGKQVDTTGVWYEPRFLLDGHFQEALVNWLQAIPSNPDAFNENSSIGRWTTLPHAKRRVAVFQTHPGFPKPIQIVVDAVAHLFPPALPPNHVLVNEYEPHQGIMPHTDGPAYHDCTATISLGEGSVLLKFVHDDPLRSYQVLLEGNGSLVVFRGESYSNFRHGIDDGVEGDVEYASDTCRNAQEGACAYRKYRISITIRHKIKS